MVHLEQRKDTWIHRDHSILYVDQISVNPEIQGNGIGRELMKMAEQFAKEHGAVRIELDYWNENEEASAFYEKLHSCPKRRG